MTTRRSRSRDAPARTVERVVTVDGPAGSGKSTLGHRLGSALALPVIDTGLFYRAITVAVVRAGLDATDTAAVIALADRLAIDINTSADPSGDGWLVRVDGVDVGAAARDPQHATLLSELSGIAEMRSRLVGRQRDLARWGAVAVGRDCGTVIFPSAPVKLYLLAPGEVRTSRRAAQLRKGGADVDAATLASEIRGRDTLDSGRAAAPLRAAADAHVIDTGRYGVEEMVDEALRICREAGLIPSAQ